MSQSKATAATLNEALSCGPVTPEGKPVPPRTAQHGLNSNTVVLANESQEKHAALPNGYLQDHVACADVMKKLSRTLIN